MIPNCKNAQDFLRPSRAINLLLINIDPKKNYNSHLPRHPRRPPSFHSAASSGSYYNTTYPHSLVHHLQLRKFGIHQPRNIMTSTNKSSKQLPFNKKQLPLSGGKQLGNKKGTFYPGTLHQTDLDNTTIQIMKQ